MKRVVPESPAHPLEGFNNLTKSLRTNLYLMLPKVEQFSRELQLRYHAASLETMLHEIAHRIEAVVLASSRQDYEPWGASALMLLSDAGPGAVHMHLNKSHLCAHTYPDFGTADDAPCLRVDLDLTSCGTISPLRSLNFILDCLQPTAAVIDYSVRGFTRDARGNILFQDHPLTCLRDTLDSQWLDVYELWDQTGVFNQTWQMKMQRRELTAAASGQMRSILQLDSDVSGT
jgi:S-adenosylmethionine decarboxylase